jgi:hypothetical protein
MSKKDSLIASILSLKPVAIAYGFDWPVPPMGVTDLGMLDALNVGELAATVLELAEFICDAQNSADASY